MIMSISVILPELLKNDMSNSTFRTLSNTLSPNVSFNNVPPPSYLSGYSSNYPNFVYGGTLFNANGSQTLPVGYNPSVPPPSVTTPTTSETIHPSLTGIEPSPPEPFPYLEEFDPGVPPPNLSHDESVVFGNRSGLSPEVVDPTPPAASLSESAVTSSDLTVPASLEYGNRTAAEVAEEQTANTIDEVATGVSEGATALETLSSGIAIGAAASVLTNIAHSSTTGVANSTANENFNTLQSQVVSGNHGYFTGMSQYMDYNRSEFANQVSSNNTRSSIAEALIGPVGALTSGFYNLATSQSTSYSGFQVASNSGQMVNPANAISSTTTDLNQ